MRKNGLYHGWHIRLGIELLNLCKMNISQIINSNKLLKFLLVGGSATLLQYIIMAILILGFDFSALFSSSFGYLVSGVFNYYLNFKYTFGGGYSHRSTVVKFFVVSALGFFINRVLLDIFLAADFPLVLSQLMATVFVVLSNFIASSLWTFKDKKGV